MVRDLNPRFDGDIDADVIDFETDTVSENGFVRIDSDYRDHCIAWVPLKTDAQLNTKTYNQNKKKYCQTYAEKDGAVNIGTEEYAGERILLLILDEVIPD